MESLILLLVIAAFAWFWLDSIKTREIAVSAARTACARESLQFLDDTVAQQGLRFVRNDAGHLILQRGFSFEFSQTGDDRHPGLVILQGRQITLLQTLVRPYDAAPRVLH